MKALNYRNETEMFAERFHMGQDLLTSLNPEADMTKPGATIQVAQVQGPPLAGTIVRIDVDKSKGQVRAYGADGKLIVSYPATVGSEELPSPSGTHKVKGVARRPVYSYDPKKNFQQGNNTRKLTIPAGPNNPVGIVYIALSKPTYGIHGTPDPSKIDKTSSHGCVRLPNWDAQELAANVRPGVVVHFLGTKGG
jgi:lipoprotein-anchoring transpeptidase ErfK/SrfK